MNHTHSLSPVEKAGIPGWSLLRPLLGWRRRVLHPSPPGGPPVRACVPSLLLTRAPVLWGWGPTPLSSLVTCEGSSPSESGDTVSPRVLPSRPRAVPSAVTRPWTQGPGWLPCAVFLQPGSHSLCGPLLPPQDRAGRGCMTPRAEKGRLGVRSVSHTRSPRDQRDGQLPLPSLGLLDSAPDSSPDGLLTLRGCSLHAGHARSRSSPSAREKERSCCKVAMRTHRAEGGPGGQPRGRPALLPPTAHMQLPSPPPGEMCWLFSENLSLGSQATPPTRHQGSLPQPSPQVETLRMATR